MPSEILAVYADGGVIRKNPSDIGGTYAFCQVDVPSGKHVDEQSGLVLVRDEFRNHAADIECLIAEGPVTNNLTEYIALTLALESMPRGWSGIAYTDSAVTRGRIMFGWKHDGIPPVWQARADRAKRRLGNFRIEMLDGHPAKAQLAAGIGKRGNPCSEHNVWCDSACGKQAERYMKEVRDGATPAG